MYLCILCNLLIYVFMYIIIYYKELILIFIIFINSILIFNEILYSHTYNIYFIAIIQIYF